MSGASVFRAAGAAYDGRYVVNGNYDTEHSKAAFGGLLSAGLPVDGVIASNDLAAFGILRCCAERGVRVPQDIKLVSFDNTDYAVMSSPTLTSVDMCQEQLGENLARSLLSRIDGRGRWKTFCSARRSSSGRAAGSIKLNKRAPGASQDAAPPGFCAAEEENRKNACVQCVFLL